MGRRMFGVRTCSLEPPELYWSQTDEITKTTNALQYSMMELNAVNLVALGAASAVAGFSTGMTSFGRAILFHTAWMVAALVLSLNSDMSDVVAILSVQAVAVVGTLAWLSRKHLNLTLLAIMLPAAVTGILIGSNILISVEDSYIKLGLGVVVFGCALWRWGATIVLQRHQHQHQRGAATVAPVAHRTIAVMPTTPGGAAADEKRQSLNSTSTTREEQQLEEAAPATESESATGTSSTKRQSLCARCRQRARRDVPSKGLAVGAGVAAFLSGLFAGIVGVAGPPLMIFVTVAQLDKSLGAALHRACLLLHRGEG